MLKKNSANTISDNTNTNILSDQINFQSNMFFDTVTTLPTKIFTNEPTT